jgi:hypothetical protein
MSRPDTCRVRYAGWAAGRQTVARRRFQRVRRRWPVPVAALAFVVAVGALAACGTADHGRNCPGHRGPDLSGRTLDGGDLTERRLKCANLERSTLDDQRLTEVKLSRANMHRASLRNTRLSNVDLSGADLTDADLGAATLDGVDLSGADLRRSAFGDGATLTDVGMRRARLDDADLRDTVLKRSDLGRADLRGADLAGAWLINSNLRGARLDPDDLAETRWADAVCPDGRKSRGTPESCDGHLTPAP